MEHETRKTVLANADLGDKDSKLKPLEEQRCEPGEEDVSLALKGFGGVSGTTKKGGEGKE